MSTLTDTTPARVIRTVRGRPTSDGAGVKLTRVIGGPDLPDLDNSHRLVFWRNNENSPQGDCDAKHCCANEGFPPFPQCLTKVEQTDLVVLQYFVFVHHNTLSISKSVDNGAFSLRPGNHPPHQFTVAMACRRIFPHQRTE